VIHGIYAEGPEPPTPFDVALARMRRGGAPTWGLVAARLYDLDAVHDLDPPDIIKRRRAQDLGGEARLVRGVLCTSPLQVMIDLATFLDDDRWEQANESGLHQKLFTIEEELALLAELTERRTPGVARIRRVLALRPEGAAPTESRLETIAVQLTRKADGVPEPTRQHVVHNRHGDFVARLDLSWPDLGGFLELDGLGHRNQPVYDATRESAVVNATGWLPNRMTWREAYNNARWATRRLNEFLDQVRRRPMPRN
jgi:very-short-patch-repair endonuclease